MSNPIVPITQIETLHEDMVHDCQFDYYSKKLATCSSDRTIKIFDVTGDIYHCSANLNNVHDGPVWQVAWAHPKFGVILASCSYDGSVVIQREQSQANWIRLYEHKVPDASVNSIAWAPHEFGLILACAASDGKIYIIEYKNASWTNNSFKNDTIGCNSVSWAPYHSVLSHGSKGNHIFRLVTGSCDNMVRVWKLEDGTGENKWEEEPKTTATIHKDWVRDVAWAPNSAIPYSLFASCSEDRTVYIWRQKDRTSGPWEPILLNTFEAPVWRLSWSVTGTVLAVSTGDHKVTLWKQSVDESWIQASSVDN